MKVRLAQPEDAKLLFEWRNDEHTRKMFVNQDAVPWDDHIKWFEGVLGNENRCLCIAVVESQPVATVRYDIDGMCAEVSVTVAPHARGKGYSSLSLSTTESLLPGNVESIRAQIRRENIASSRAFENAGYELSEEAEEYVYYLKKRS